MFKNIEKCKSQKIILIKKFYEAYFKILYEIFSLLLFTI